MTEVQNKTIIINITDFGPIKILEADWPIISAIESGDYLTMAKIRCAISGLTLEIPHVPLTLSAEIGYYHPIFALPYRKLYGLYSKHCAGELTETDSYLLFLAFLHSTEQIKWEAPASLTPGESTSYLVENNLLQLIKIIETTSMILHPAFVQPSFVVSKDNSLLHQIPNWIEAWENNIKDFQEGYKSKRMQEDLQKLENKLSYYLKSGLNPEEYAFAVASWADKAAGFPNHKTEEWCKIIRTCFNSERMFSTPLLELKKIKAYCEENIEVGSIHFHALMSTLNEGINRNLNFLGVSGISIQTVGYNLIPPSSTAQSTELAAIIANAPEEPPKRTEYSSDMEFLKAKLRYRVLSLHQKGSNTQ